jgi:hypothetical protein
MCKGCRGRRYEEQQRKEHKRQGRDQTIKGNRRQTTRLKREIIQIRKETYKWLSKKKEEEDRTDT